MEWKMNQIEYLKRLADRMSMDTLKALLDMDHTLTERENRLTQAEQLFAGLPLSDAESHVIDTMLSCMGEIDNERIRTAYMAGMIDCVALLTKLGILEI